MCFEAARRAGWLNDAAQRLEHVGFGMVCGEDGKPYKTLRRHLAGHGLTPDDYRQRYGLKADYPMVAESYSQARRDMAKKIGLGRKPGGRTAAAAPSDEGAATEKAPRGRRKAAASADA